MTPGENSLQDIDYLEYSQPRTSFFNGIDDFCMICLPDKSYERYYK
jgi:hypothetical protein